LLFDRSGAASFLMFQTLQILLSREGVLQIFRRSSQFRVIVCRNINQSLEVPCLRWLSCIYRCSSGLNEFGSILLYFVIMLWFYKRISWDIWLYCSTV